MNVFRREGRVKTHFVFREGGVIILFPLLSSPNEDAYPMLNSGLLLCSSEIKISANITLCLFVEVSVTLTKFSIRNKNHFGCKQNIYVCISHFLLFLKEKPVLEKQICLLSNLLKEKL